MADVTDNTAESRYEISLDGKPVGLMDYVLSGGKAILPHTAINSAYGGQGLGQILVRTALDEFRERGVKVRPSCSFVRHYIETHPEYRDLVEGS